MNFNTKRRSWNLDRYEEVFVKIEQYSHEYCRPKTFFQSTYFLLWSNFQGLKDPEVGIFHVVGYNVGVGWKADVEV